MPYNFKTELQRYRRYYQSVEPVLNKPSSRVYTTIIFSFLVISLLGWYAIRPTLQTIFYLRREIVDKTEVNTKMEEKIGALIEAQAYYQEIEPLIPAVDESLPTNPDALPALIQLRNLASRSGVLISSVQFPSVPLLTQSKQTAGSKTTAVASKQQTIDFTVIVRGAYPALRSFLNGIMNMRRIMTVNGVTFAPAQLESTSSQSAVLSGRVLQLTLRLRTYYLVK